MANPNNTTKTAGGTYRVLPAGENTVHVIPGKKANEYAPASSAAGRKVILSAKPHATMPDIKAATQADLKYLYETKVYVPNYFISKV